MPLRGFLVGPKRLFALEAFGNRKLKYDSELKWRGDGPRGDQIIAMVEGMKEEGKVIGNENLENYYNDLLHGKKAPEFS